MMGKNPLNKRSAVNRIMAAKRQARKLSRQYGILLKPFRMLRDTVAVIRDLEKALTRLSDKDKASLEIELGDLYDSLLPR